MKRVTSKLIIFGLIFLSISCKRDGVDSLISTTNDIKKEILKNVSGTMPIGQCLTEKAGRIRDWVNTYGAGGTKQNDPTGAMNELRDIANKAYECKNGSGSGGTVPIAPVIPISDASGINNIYEFLTFLGVGNVCSNPQLYSAKSKVMILNEIIGRVVNGSNSASYYTSDNNTKLTLILISFHADEAYLLDDDGFTLTYLNVVVERQFDIPEIIATAVLGKDPNYFGPGEDNGQYFDWRGFKIDNYLSNISNYCSTTILSLPSPLPSIIYYQTNYPNDLQLSLALSTPINAIGNRYFSATSDGEYYPVPNGYYKHPNDADNHRYYHIVNGIVTEIVYAIS